MIEQLQVVKITADYTLLKNEPLSASFKFFLSRNCMKFYMDV